MNRARRFVLSVWIAGSLLWGLSPEWALGQTKPPRPVQVTQDEASQVQGWCLGPAMRGPPSHQYVLLRLHRNGAWEELPGNVHATSLLPLPGQAGLLLTQAGQLLHWMPGAASSSVLPHSDGKQPTQVRLTQLLAWRELPEGGVRSPPTQPRAGAIAPAESGNAVPGSAGTPLPQRLEVLVMGWMGVVQYERLLVVKLEAGRIGAIRPAVSSPDLKKRGEFFKTWRVYRCREQGPERACLTPQNSVIATDRRTDETSTLEKYAAVPALDFADAAWESASEESLYVLARKKK